MDANKVAAFEPRAPVALHLHSGRKARQAAAPVLVFLDPVDVVDQKKGKWAAKPAAKAARVAGAAIPAPAASMDAKVWRRESSRIHASCGVFEPTRIITHDSR